MNKKKRILLVADFGLAAKDAAAAMGVRVATLRIMLLRLAAPTDKAKKLIEESGMEIFDTEGNMLPLLPRANVSTNPKHQAKLDEELERRGEK